MNTDEETNFDPFEADVETTEEDVTTESEVVEEEAKNKSEEEDDPKGDTESEDEGASKEETLKEEKSISESRFKAAIKDIQTKLDSALQENAELRAGQVKLPNREEDPDGYEQHLRLEMSKSLMMEFKEDYAEVIQHYQEMAKVNPTLNKLVAENELPAKFAYDLAKRDMEIRELTAARNSDEWKEFQEFKKNKSKQSTAQDLATPVERAPKLPENTNRATSVTLRNNVVSDDDDLFRDAPLDNV